MSAVFDSVTCVASRAAKWPINQGNCIIGPTQTSKWNISPNTLHKGKNARLGHGPPSLSAPVCLSRGSNTQHHAGPRDPPATVTSGNVVAGAGHGNE